MSKSRAQRTFTSSAAKDYVRHVVDRDIIRGFRNQHYPDQQLAYLGLPGEAILDILSWREFIGYCTAIEDNAPTLNVRWNSMCSRIIWRA